MENRAQTRSKAAVKTAWKYATNRQVNEYRLTLIIDLVERVTKLRVEAFDSPAEKAGYIAELWKAYAHASKFITDRHTIPSESILGKKSGKDPEQGASPTAELGESHYALPAAPFNYPEFESAMTNKESNNE